MRRRHGYPRDPYWTEARYDGTAHDGTPIKVGDRILVWPMPTRTVHTGADAEERWRAFQADLSCESGFLL